MAAQPQGTWPRILRKKTRAVDKTLPVALEMKTLCLSPRSSDERISDNGWRTGPNPIDLDKPDIHDTEGQFLPAFWRAILSTRVRRQPFPGFPPSTQHREEVLDDCVL